MTITERVKTDGPVVAEFIETFCRNSKGEAAGELIGLRPWQHEILDGLFALTPTGQRKHRTAYIGLPRKNGKSTLGAALALYALIADGEAGAEVYSCAGDRQQARIVFDEAKRMAEADPELRGIVKVQRNHIEVPATGAIYRVLSADAALQQGLNPSMVLFDEVHVQPNRDLWDAMTLARGARRRPMVIGITTAGFDKQSLAWELYDHGRKVSTGEVVDPTFYYWWSDPSETGADWRDPKVWAQANPALGDFLYVAALEENVRITPESAFRRFHLNQWTTTRSAWLPHGAWDACTADMRPDPGTEVVLGFDGAWTEDSTAIIGCTVGTNHLFTVRVWEKPAGEPAWQTPTAEVDAEMLDACSTWKVREIACDPHQWREQLARWVEMGLPVIEWPTNSLQRMVPACSEFYRAVMEKRLSHDGNPTLARHIANAVIKEDRFGRRIVKDRASQKIDAAVAAVIAYDRARQAPARKPSRYNAPDSRGIVTA